MPVVVPDFTLEDLAALRVRWEKNKTFLPHTPHPNQLHFLLREEQEVFYGGAAGGGKSDALLMGALEYMDVPGYSALILRRTGADLDAPGGLVPRSKEWLQGKTRWNSQKKTHVFPSGATLHFAHCETEDDRFRFGSQEYQYIAFEELTEFTKQQYLYITTRARRTEDLTRAGVPIRIRSASNPGGVGHIWVKRRFVDRNSPFPFIPSKIEDNPSLNRAEYLDTLSQLDTVDRERLMKGNWEIQDAGDLFVASWFEVVQAVPMLADSMDPVRAWDFAATSPAKGKEPDWTAGVRMREVGGIFYIEDIARFQRNPGETLDRVANIASQDGFGVDISIEQEPGASGKIATDHIIRNILPGYSVIAMPATGNKFARMKPLSSAARAGNVKLVESPHGEPWIEEFLEEVALIPNGTWDDQADAAAQAHAYLTRGGVAIA